MSREASPDTLASVEVIQADRIAAADILVGIGHWSRRSADAEIITGERDDLIAVQTCARHRLAYADRVRTTAAERYDPDGGQTFTARDHAADCRATPPQDAAERMREALTEARLQLEYLDGKHPSGTTPAVLARITAALAIPGDSA